jgi:probable selenium-dependent hydroxylase accessory protein YqeC
MKTTTITEALQLNPDNGCIISFCGGGGKTSSIYKLAKELQALNKTVLVTTTTKIKVPHNSEYDNLLISPNFDNIPVPSRGSITVAGGKLLSPHQKINGLTFKELELIHKQDKFQFILIEADGAARRPIKAPAAHEPVIYPATDILIGVIGIDSYKKKINSENVHRPEFFTQVTKQLPDTLIEKETYLKLIQSPQGLFKNAPPTAQKIWFLNKVDNGQQLKEAIRLAYYIQDHTTLLHRIVITSLQTENYVKQIL